MTLLFSSSSVSLLMPEFSFLLVITGPLHPLSILVAWRMTWLLSPMSSVSAWYRSMQSPVPSPKSPVPLLSSSALVWEMPSPVPLLLSPLPKSQVPSLLSSALVWETPPPLPVPLLLLPSPKLPVPWLSSSALVWESPPLLLSLALLPKSSLALFCS